MSLTKVSYSMINTPVVNVQDYGAVGNGTTNDAAAFNAALATFANYSIPANPTNGGTLAGGNTGGTAILGAFNYDIATTINVPIYSAIKGTYPYLGGQGEAGFFGSRINNQVTSGPAIRLETASIEGVGFFKQTATQNEAIRIVSQFCEVKSCQMDTHKYGIRFSNDIANDAAVYAHIHDCTFLHQNDPTTGSISVTNSGAGYAASMGGALIENNNFNVSSAEGYTGVTAIKMDGTTPVSVTIRKNQFQNFANGAGAAALELSMSGGVVENNDIACGASIGAGQVAIQVSNGSGNVVRDNRISGFYYGIRMQATLSNSVIGPNYFTGNTNCDILIDAGCANNIIILTNPNTVVVDNNPGQNLYIKSWLKQPFVLSQSAVAAGITGTTAETALATITVPAGILGPNGTMRIYTTWSGTNSANAKTLRVRYSTISGTAFQQVAVTTYNSISLMCSISNRNSVSSQTGGAGADAIFGGGSTSNPATATINTNAATTLVITAQLASAGEQYTLQSYYVEVTPG